MKYFKSTGLLVSSFVAVACAFVPAHAASSSTEAFLANVTANVDFLDRSSRMALENSKSTKVKEFARVQAKDQTLAANALYDVTSKAPAEPLQTGRSVAIAGQAVPAVDNRLPLGQEDLDSIEGLNGIEFDEAYRAKQRDALLQVQADYEMYIAAGDDAALKEIATQELPKVKKQISALGKV